jgi:hypothetical protein
MSQRGKSEFCYLLKFRFHGQLDLLFESKAVSPVEWNASQRPLPVATQDLVRGC